MIVSHERLTAEEIHELATAPLPPINIIQPKTHAGSNNRSDYGGAYKDLLNIEGFTYDQHNVHSRKY